MESVCEICNVSSSIFKFLAGYIYKDSIIKVDNPIIEKHIRDNY